MNRRTFVKGAALSAGGAWLASLPLPALGRPGPSAAERIQAGVIGVRGRGHNLLDAFAGMDDVDIRHVCDIDGSVLEERAGDLEKETRHRPRRERDFRKVIDDPEVDVIVLGTPDHWHAIPTILGCQAGKDVYTEKPDGHDLVESYRMAAAQRLHKRVVQMGTQSRSAPHILEAIEYLRSGAIGKVRYATSWESMRQGSLGRPADGEPPPDVDYDRWLGPAPKRPFNPLRFHGNWRWFFDYGTGDLGNDGVHRIDYARWALGAALEAEGEKLPELPVSVSGQGGKYYFDDAQEWPDMLIATYDYGTCLLSYELRIWTPYPLHGDAEGAAIYGDRGYVVIANRRWRAFDEKGEVIREVEGKGNLDATGLHVRNFLDCTRSRKRSAADLATIGHVSSLLCHLGNASWRAGQTLHFDPATRTLPREPEAQRFLGRAEYRAPYLLPEVEEPPASSG